MTSEGMTSGQDDELLDPSPVEPTRTSEPTNAASCCGHYAEEMRVKINRCLKKMLNRAVAGRD